MKTQKTPSATNSPWQKEDAPAAYAMLCVFGGIFGFIYEMLFYYIDGGMKYWYWRGECFGPWIMIYSVGCMILYFTCYRYRKKPLKVFILSGLICGAIEFSMGAAIYHFGNGLRLWDYNEEIWHFGNIYGFVCLRSILFFAISGLILVYVLVPLTASLRRRQSRGKFYTISFLLFALFLADMIYNHAIAPEIGTLTANEFWESTGLFRVMEFHQ